VLEGFSNTSGNSFGNLGGVRDGNRDSNLKGPGPRGGAVAERASRVAKEIGDRQAGGGRIGLLVLAIVLWRCATPCVVDAKAVRAVEPRDHVRARRCPRTRAFDTAMHVYSADAMLESLPNQIRVRHTRLTVRAPTSDEAIEMASRMSLAMASAFAKEGPATLSIDVRHRTTPVEECHDDGCGLCDAPRRRGRGPLGVLLIASVGSASRPALTTCRSNSVAGGRRLGAGRGFPSSCPATSSWRCSSWPCRVDRRRDPVEGGTQVRHAAAWPSTRGRIVRSTLRAQHHRMQADVTKVSNAADVEYEYTWAIASFAARAPHGDITAPASSRRSTITASHQRCRCITIRRIPRNALLERDPPVPVGGSTPRRRHFLGGLVCWRLFWNISAIFDGLSAYFPEKAFLPGMAFSP